MPDQREQLTAILQDVRFAARRLGKEPGFVVLAAATLALGIGFTTTVFGVLQNAVLNPFPYVDSKGIVVFQIRNPASPGRGDRSWFSGQEFVAYRKEVGSFGETIGISTDEEVLYATPNGTERLSGASVSGNTFRFLGVDASIGRALSAEDAKPTATPVFVMSHALWSRLGQDSAQLNRTFALNGVATTLVGVMPPRLTLFGADLWRPAALEVVDSLASSRAISLQARLKPGASLEQAESEFRTVAQRLAPGNPRLYPKAFVVKGMTLVDSATGRLQATLRLFAGAVAVLLLIACANVSNMLLARVVNREREMAIRASLGASRLVLVRQLFVEAALVALLSAAAGCLVAHLGMKALVRLAPDGLIPAEAVIRLNLPVLSFSLVAAIGSVVVFGLLPAIRRVGPNLMDQLRGSASANGGLRIGLLNDSIVIVAVTLSLVLLTGAGLLARTFMNLQSVALGLEPKDVAFVQLRFPAGRYRTAAEKQQLLDNALVRVRALPGVVSASAASAVPLDGGVRTGLEIPGVLVDSAALSLVQLCADDYFATLGFRMRRGRVISAEDVREARRVVVINETLARRYFGDADPLGKRIRILALEDKRDDSPDPTFEIIGLVGDTKNHGIREPAIPESFVPASITAAFGRSILVRTARFQGTLMAAVQREVWAVDRSIAFTRQGSVDEGLKRYAYAEPRFNSFVVSVLAGVALLLVALGICGVIAYAVSRQVRDIGVRMALGATSHVVLWMVLRKGLLLVGTGIVVGLGASMALTRFASSQLWGVEPRDPLTLVTVSALLLATGIVASLVPAWRAVRVDPLIALRAE